MRRDSARGPGPLSSTVIAPARYPTRVKLLLDILQGLGLAQAAGIRPFLPALVAGGAARADVLIDFEGGPFAFMEDPWWLAALAALALGALIIRNEIPRRPPLSAAFQGLALGMGALLFSAVLSGDGYTWWPGIPAGLAGAWLSMTAMQDLFDRAGSAARRGGARAPADLRRGRRRRAGRPVDRRAARRARLRGVLHLAASSAAAAGSGEKHAGLRVLR